MGVRVRVPPSAPKQKVILSDDLLFWVPPPGGRLHPLVMEMLGASELPLRRGFACGKTLVRRKGAAGQKAGFPVLPLLSQALKISILTALYKKGTPCGVSFFVFHRPEGCSTLWGWKCSGQVNRPCAAPLCEAPVSRRHLYCCDVPKRKTRPVACLPFCVPMAGGRLHSPDPNARIHASLFVDVGLAGWCCTLQHHPGQDGQPLGRSAQIQLLTLLLGGNERLDGPLRGTKQGEIHLFVIWHRITSLLQYRTIYSKTQ